MALSGGRPSAAKTGTEGIETGKHKGGNSDAWMVGYTPQVSTAVWVGSGNSTTPIYNSYGAPSTAATCPGATWKMFMDTWLAGKPAQPLPTKQQIRHAGAARTPRRRRRRSHAPPTNAPSEPSSTAPTTSTAPPTTVAPPTTTQAAAADAAHPPPSAELRAGPCCRTARRPARPGRRRHAVVVDRPPHRAGSGPSTP